MPVLNEDKDWSEYERIPKIREAFSGSPTKTLLPSGRMLCRFITTEADKSKLSELSESGIYSSPWWMDWNTTAALLDKGGNANAPIIAVIRARLAVTSEFSAKLDGLAQVILKEPVYAWKGIARYQDDISLKITYIGGGEQLFLPNLVDKKHRSSLYCNYAYMHFFTNAVDLLR